MPKKSASKKKKKKKISLQTKILFATGLLLIIIPLFFYLNEGIQLAFFTPHVIATPKKYAAPTQISISAINIHMPIIEEALSHNVWGIADNGISHLAISARPGEDGPIILYGHNTNDRFGPIRWLSNGQKITISTSDGKQHTYTIRKTMDVSPNQVSVLISQKGQTLILYTCDGFADLQRFVVIAKPS